MYNILVVDDNTVECNSLVELLKCEGYSIKSATNGKVASEMLKQSFFNVVITDINMPEVTGFDLLKQIKEKCLETSVIFITGYGEIKDAVAAIKLGAIDYIMKPFDDDALMSVISGVVGHKILQNARLKKRKNLRFDGVIGGDKEMQRIMELIKVVAKSNVTVLITGESGTGKSLFAKAIHYNSARKDKPYIEVLCGAIPETLFESEMFGYSKGSFTGAINEKPGAFEMADGGTILLDEIYSAPPSSQIKLLRVLQDKKFKRVGDLNLIKANVKFIVATNCDLQSEVKKGNFRKDLYHRINVLPINIPPLRERKCDIEPLAEHFLYTYGQKYDKKNLLISDETMCKLKNYSWPGNVRELENVIQRAIITAGGAYIETHDLPLNMNEYAPKLEGIGNFSLKKAMEKPERELIRHTLRYFNGNKNKTAKVLKLNRTTLYKKMRKHNL